MAIMLGSKAVTAVLKRINEAKIKPTLQEGETALKTFIRAYKYEKGVNEKGEYITVNSLPFTHDSNIGNGTVNVNVHEPRTKSNEVPSKRLEKVCNQVIALFPKETMIDGISYSFHCDSQPMEDNDRTYFVNLKIEVVYTDIQTE